MSAGSSTPTDEDFTFSTLKKRFQNHETPNPTNNNCSRNQPLQSSAISTVCNGSELCLSSSADDSSILAAGICTDTDSDRPFGNNLKKSIGLSTKNGMHGEHLRPTGFDRLTDSTSEWGICLRNDEAPSLSSRTSRLKPQVSPKSKSKAMSENAISSPQSVIQDEEEIWPSNKFNLAGIALNEPKINTSLLPTDPSEEDEVFEKSLYSVQQSDTIIPSILTQNNQNSEVQNSREGDIIKNRNEIYPKISKSEQDLVPSSPVVLNREIFVKPPPPPVKKFRETVSLHNQDNETTSKKLEEISLSPVLPQDTCSNILKSESKIKIKSTLNSSEDVEKEVLQDNEESNSKKYLLRSIVRPPPVPPKKKKVPTATLR